MWLRNFSLIQRLGIIVALTALLFLVLTGVVLNQHYKALKEKSYKENQHLVEIVHTLLANFEALEGVDEEAAKIGVTRTALIKMWVAEQLKT